MILRKGLVQKMAVYMSPAQNVVSTGKHCLSHKFILGFGDIVAKLKYNIMTLMQLHSRHTQNRDRDRD